MLPNHAPLAVAEQFALLEAAHPGRIDLGISRAPGSDPVTSLALRGAAGRDDRDIEAFPEYLDDVVALMNGRYLVFGLGTFGPGVCQLSERVEQVFYFASGWPQHFKSIPTIGRVVEVLDVAGGYTKVGEWDNSPERRQLMLDYLPENLAFDDA